MISRMSNISIDYIGLTTRSLNALHNAKIFTIGDLQKLTDYDIDMLQNVGEKSKVDIKEKLLKFINNFEKRPEEYNSVEDALSEFEHVNMLCCNDDISALNISVRTYNALRRAGINTISQARSMSDADLGNIANMGVKSILDLRTCLDEFSQELSRQEKYVVFLKQSGVDLKIMQFIIALCSDINKFDNNVTIRDIILNIVGKNKELHESIEAYDSVYDAIADSNIMNVIYSDDNFGSIIEGIILSALGKNGAMEYTELIKCIPCSLFHSEQFVGVLNKMICDGKVDCYCDLYDIVRPFLDDYIDSLDDRYRFILTAKLDGMSLEFIGQQVGITKERVRQLLFKMFAKMPVIYEDRYKYWFQTYDFNEEYFCYIFDVNPHVYRYFVARYGRKKSGDIAVDDIVYDSYATADMLDKYRSFGSRDYVYDDNFGVSIPLNDDGHFIARMIMRGKFMDQSVDLHIVHKMYLDVCKRHNFDKLFNDALDFHNFSNRIIRARYVLLSKNYNIRYYDIDSNNINNSGKCVSDLIRAIDFSKYMNCVISSEKIFSDNMDLMVEFDIVDGCELHNLFRKNMSMLPSDVSLDRMPVVNVGKVDRDKQVINLLHVCAPIGCREFRKLFKDLYGINEDTFVSNWSNCVASYLNNGVYEI